MIARTIIGVCVTAYRLSSWADIFLRCRVHPTIRRALWELESGQAACLIYSSDDSYKHKKRSIEIKAAFLGKSVSLTLDAGNLGAFKTEAGHQALLVEDECVSIILQG